MGRRGPGKDISKKRVKADKLEQSQKIREELGKYQRVYVIQFSSRKTDHLVDIRRKFRTSTLCMAKHSILKHALGVDASTSAIPNAYLLNQHLEGNAGLFMTNESHEDVIAFFQSLTGPEYPKTGDAAPITFTVPAGPLPQFNFSMDSFLRELGLPVQLENGTILNVRDFTVCEEGQPLTKNARKLLKQFEQKCGTFHAEPVAYWQNGEVFTPNQ